MSCDLVIGIGEIGGPLADLLSLKRNVIKKDVGTLIPDAEIDTMHVCFPYSKTFVETVLDYVDEFAPVLIVIHSTVVPGTTKLIAEKTCVYVAYSPVRGRHAEMHRDLIRYTKFVAAPCDLALQAAVEYFDETGLFHVETMSNCETLELAKLIRTSYSGLLIAWAQEMSRYCEELGADYEEMLGLAREVENLSPAIFYPGHIQGHCIMSNLDLLEAVRPSPFIDAIRQSNEACTEEQKADKTRHRPRRLR